MFTNLLRFLFYVLILRPFVFIIIGMNIRNLKRLPKHGPAIIVANHNSHLDTLGIKCLFPIFQMKNVFPLAAADYFLRNKILAWFVLNILGVIPVDRKSSSDKTRIFERATEELNKGNIILIFPEGSRGEAEKLAEFKKGVAYLAKQNPQVPVVPIHFVGFGKSLPKGEALFIPFICDGFIGEPIFGEDNIDEFMSKLKISIEDLQKQHHLSTTDF